MAISSQPPARPNGSPDPPSAGDRLDSWKEIAQFLKRDVRTVQRWEKLAGLPVHRHAESRLRTAYAYRSELEAWWRTQSAAIDAATSGDDAAATAGTPAPSEDPPRRPHAWPRPLLFASLALAVVVAALAGIAGYPRLEVTPARPQPPLTVLLTGFENQTGNSGVGALLDEVVRRELTAEEAIEVVPPARVARLLRLMRRDPVVAVTESVARDLSARDDGIGLVLAGTVRRVESTYFVSIRVIDPDDGRLRAGVGRQAHDVSQLPVTVREAAAQIRARLLHAPPAARRGRERLEEVTTPSLSALRLYTQAVRAGRRRQWAASELLARRAIEVDDQFASAFAGIAWAMRNQGRPAAEYLPIAERAVGLSRDTTDREVYFIRGTYFNLAGDIDKAAAAYEALLRLKPDDARVMEVLIDCYSRAGRMVEAVQRTVTRANTEPDDFYANLRAAHALAIWHRDPGGARPFVERSQRLVSHETMRDRPFWSAWLALLPGFEQWLNSDVQGMLDTVTRVEPEIESRIGRERDGLSTAIGFSYLAAGRLRQAEAAFRTASSPTRQINLAMLSLAAGAPAKAREWLLQIPEHSTERPALFAAVGLLDEAERGVSLAFGADHGMTEVTRGLILLGRGRSAEAIAPLRRGLELLRYTGEPEYFWAAEALSRIWVGRHDAPRALQVLADATRQRPRTYSGARWSGAYWMKTANDLAALYDSMHRPADAARLRATMGPLLRFADPDHPLTHPRRTIDPVS